MFKMLPKTVGITKDFIFVVERRNFAKYGLTDCMQCLSDSHVWVLDIFVLIELPSSHKQIWALKCLIL